jgi:ankyrin repeat protein
MGKNDSIFNFLMAKGADYTAYDHWGNPACYAALYGRTAFLKVLLDKGVSPDSRTVYGATLLHFAIGNSNYDTVELLIKHKARMDIRDEDGNTVLERAKKSKDDKMIKMLEEAGAK